MCPVRLYNIQFDTLAAQNLDNAPLTVLHDDNVLGADRVDHFLKACILPCGDVCGLVIEGLAVEALQLGNVLVDFLLVIGGILVASKGFCRIVW